MQKLMACNNGVDSSLQKAYDEWNAAEAKFKKWWNPSRRLSEGGGKIPRDAQDKQSAFSRTFRDVTGKFLPNGWGTMTLDQMLKSVGVNSTVCNADEEFCDVEEVKPGKWVWHGRMSGKKSREFGSSADAMADAKRNGAIPFSVMSLKAWKGVKSVMRQYNSRACNAKYTKNTPVGSIDYQFKEMYPGYKLGDFVDVYKELKCIPRVDEEADTLARDKFYDAMREITGVKCRWARNSRACNSWKPATGGVCVGDLVIHKAQYQAHKNDEEWLDRNCTRVKTVTAEGFQDKWSGTYEFENPKDYMVLNSRACNSVNPVVIKAVNAVCTNRWTPKYKEGDKVKYKGGEYTVEMVFDDADKETAYSISKFGSTLCVSESELK